MFVDSEIDQLFCADAPLSFVMKDLGTIEVTVFLVLHVIQDSVFSLRLFLCIFYINILQCTR